MDLGSIPLFGALHKRMAWLNQRSRVLAENVANADTPKFRPKDLKPQAFADLLKGQGQMARVMPATTAAGHLSPVKAGTGQFAEHARRDIDAAEVSPTGNAVNIEEQMMKVGETQLDYQLATNLYRKHLGMLKIALGRGGGGG
jgi:flagellar basal-body rod protein FlgB